MISILPNNPNGGSQTRVRELFSMTSPTRRNYTNPCLCLWCWFGELQPQYHILTENDASQSQHWEKKVVVGWGPRAAGHDNRHQLSCGPTRSIRLLGDLKQIECDGMGMASRASNEMACVPGRRGRHHPPSHQNLEVHHSRRVARPDSQPSIKKDIFVYIYILLNGIFFGFKLLLLLTFLY
jgi:hypothetical protein